MIHVEDLHKSFDGFPALDGLSLNVEKGSVYGLIGVNGSGKTTLIKHLTGILRQDSGVVQIDGQDVYDNADVKARTGYVPDELYFFPGYDLKHMAAFYKGVYPKWDGARFEEMTGRFGLPKDRKIGRFSKGMQRQSAIALTLAAMPEVLILDEPVDGLDPIVRKLVWNYILADVAERQTTVLISSHNLRELEGICDHIGILYRGKLRAEHGNLDELESENGLPGLEEMFFSEMGGDAYER